MGSRADDLAKRFKGQTQSIETYRSEASRRLLNAQERALIEQINKLTLRKMPSTNQIVRNFAEGLARSKLRKNWGADFIRCHKNKLTSLYLRNIDNMRKKADYAPSFRLFYDLA